MGRGEGVFFEDAGSQQVHLELGQSCVPTWLVGLQLKSLLSWPPLCFLCGMEGEAEGKSWSLHVG